MPDAPETPDVPRSPTGRVPRWVLDETISNGGVRRFPERTTTPRRTPRAAKPPRTPRSVAGYGGSGGIGGRGYRTSRRGRLLVASLFFVVPISVALILMLAR